jgi:predicted RecB family nuclease
MAFKRLTARRQWVSKTDLSRWYRCPYAFWLLDSGRITFAETVSQFQLALIHAGNEYHELVEQSATPVILAPDDLPALLRTDITILSTPLFENKQMKLRGYPDGIDAASGALYPIEIKSHRAPTPLDGLELAFYWLLLEPHRTRPACPAGVLILRRDGKPFRVDVPITATMLATVKQMIGEVRSVRKNGVNPRVCGCAVCSKARRDDVIQSVTERGDVSMILGVGRVYSAALEAAGYATWDTLTNCDAEAVARIITQSGAKGCSRSRVSGWQMHARALASGLPEIRPDAQWPIDGPYIALDLEYDVTPDKDHIWLTGAAIITSDGPEHHSWWADTPGQLREALNGLSALLRQHPGLPVVTWAGHSADLPRVRAAGTRLGLQDLTAEITSRHFDAYQWALNNLRLPTLDLGLKTVSHYLSFRPSSDVHDGIDALMLYYDWLKSQDETIRGRLTDYNRDDLDALALTVARFRELSEDSRTDRHGTARQHAESQNPHRPLRANPTHLPTGLPAASGTWLRPWIWVREAVSAWRAASRSARIARSPRPRVVLLAKAASIGSRGGLTCLAARVARPRRGAPHRLAVPVTGQATPVQGLFMVSAAAFRRGSAAPVPVGAGRGAITFLAGFVRLAAQPHIVPDLPHGVSRGVRRRDDLLDSSREQVEFPKRVSFRMAAHPMRRSCWLARLA